jgi:hypothetical protein
MVPTFLLAEETSDPINDIILRQGRCRDCSKIKVYEFIQDGQFSQATLRDLLGNRNLSVQEMADRYAASLAEELRYSPQELRSLREVIDLLTHQHIDGKYLYRGQVKRYPAFKRVFFNGAAYLVEQLLPSDLRFVAGHHSLAGPSKEEITAGRKKSRDTRDRFQTYLLDTPHALSNHPFVASLRQSRDQWMSEGIMRNPIVRYFSGKSPLSRDEVLDITKDLRNPNRKHLGLDLLEQQFARTAWSLAQHYVISTALVDLTSDIQVAAWFATHFWGSDDRPTGEGVIYRFEVAKIHAVLEEITVLMRNNAVAQGIGIPPPLFLESVCHIPVDFALRPSRQAGFSVFGFDQINLLKLLEETGAFEVFRFPHEANTPYLAHVDREYLTPSKDDPFFEVLASFPKP